ncbi:lysin B [Gordonia phage Lucky10]|uniref:Lysin B n=1 Tax=Gordonia phage Lucky10 TaxID=1821557 RepID=A0A142KAY4_9CAUD|nr:lysin B [Gordonia phage Lucky10]AMS03267.1 lysin B [Gordonia phage Lucky10]
MIEVLFCDGTWSRPGARSPVGEALRKALDPRRVKFTYVDYAADYGPATGAADLSYEESVAEGVAALEAAVVASPYFVVVAGYSQGAVVALRYVRDVLPRRPKQIVLALATLGDPHQEEHNGRSGIAGALAVSIRSFRRFVPGDPIADLGDGSPLRRVADLTAWMSVRSPESVRTWATQTAQKLRTSRPWWNPFRWPDFARAGEDIGNYLGTKHTTDYIQQGHVAKLARDIESVA